MITLECTVNEDCSATSDTCISNTCYCGSKEKCTEGADRCMSGQCKCGEKDECSSTDFCHHGTCAGKNSQYPKFVDDSLYFRLWCLTTLEIGILYNLACSNPCDENHCSGYTCDFFIQELGCDHAGVKKICEKACGLCENGE